MDVDGMRTLDSFLRVYCFHLFSCDFYEAIMEHS